MSLLRYGRGRWTAARNIETLAEVGEWIVTYDSGEAVRARVRRRIA